MEGDFNGDDGYGSSSYGGYSGPGGSYSTVYPPGGGPEQRNPFQTALPPTGRIATVLGVYFLVVVPLNFMILKKIRRGELAWLTAPVISLAAAGVLFSSASGLYGAKMATSSRGVLVMQDGSNDAYFVGSSQMFFPSGGSIDLGLHGVEEIQVAANDRYSITPMADDSLDSVDVGEVQVPALRATNLAFKEMYYRQHLQISPMLQAELIKDPQGLICKIRNVSSETLDGVVVMCRGQSYPLGAPLMAGEERSLTLALGSSMPTPSPGVQGGPPTGSDDPVNRFTWERPEILVTANLRGFRPGPQVGSDYGSNIQLLYCKAFPEGVR
jgi:hypothetical protein